jgi:hypothetical protein
MHYGADIIATAGSQHKLDYLRSLERAASDQLSVEHDFEAEVEAPDRVAKASTW